MQVAQGQKQRASRAFIVPVNFGRFDNQCVEERQSISTDLYELSGPPQACDDVAGIDDLLFLAPNAGPHP